MLIRLLTAPLHLVYNSTSQTAYVTENIWGKVTTEENLTHEDLMELLEQATENAKQLAGEE